MDAPGRAANEADGGLRPMPGGQPRARPPATDGKQAGVRPDSSLWGQPPRPGQAWPSGEERSGQARPSKQASRQARKQGRLCARPSSSACILPSPGWLGPEIPSSPSCNSPPPPVRGPSQPRPQAGHRQSDPILRHSSYSSIGPSRAGSDRPRRVGDAPAASPSEDRSPAAIEAATAGLPTQLRTQHRLASCPPIVSCSRPQDPVHLPPSALVTARAGLPLARCRDRAYMRTRRVGPTAPMTIITPWRRARLPRHPARASACCRRAARRGR
ncbi:uncharacterized protein PFL1_05786 [Pseudozyma flocculosa PF-1]|uniref:Uncharacterized protein n=1 Tax=Pseudozyma flocculosa PF-1 TaxID=1277687 RepID=A0A061H2V3_9BASI|nr:uncharacterized protein PFL1_05786 [Pseudozyma flocculosa PF-1]EPQ26808.1 hypothetical protein PFL1_05786 [Pseudozyma flocculosa PF-1]